MLDFEEARARMLQLCQRLRPDGLQRERVPVRMAAGRVLAEDVSAPLPLPRYDYSAMDGYAVRSRDLADAETRLRLCGEARAGHQVPPVKPGGCVRIFTGAGIPEGADAVVMQENTEPLGEQVKILKAVGPGTNIRRAGEDLQEGARALPRGVRLTGFHLGLLASVERTEVLVARRPVVSIVCTGDELRPPGHLSAAGSTEGLADSNGVALAALVEQWGGIARLLSTAADDLDTTTAALAEARVGADVVLTVGGVSVGDHDLVRPALEALGAQLEFWKIRIRPGKPLLLAELDSSICLGLPGNPSSAQVTFALFGAPLLRALQGDREPVAVPRTARLLEPFRQKPGRRGFYRARLTGDEVAILSNQASGASTAMAWANSMVVLGEDIQDLEAGAEVQVLPYSEL